MNSKVYYRINQKKNHWMLVVASVHITDNGIVALDYYPLKVFKDISKDYIVVIHKADYNGMLIVKSYNDITEAYEQYNNRYNTLSTTSACIIKKEYNEVLKKNEYSIIDKDCTSRYTSYALQLIAPASLYSELDGES